MDLNKDKVTCDKLKLQSLEVKTSFDINALGPYLVAKTFSRLLRFNISSRNLSLKYAFLPVV